MNVCTVGLVALLCSAVATAQSDGVQVETVLPAGSAIDDALILGPGGDLFGSRWGASAQNPGRTVTRVDLASGTASVFADGLVNANGLGFDSGGDLYAVSWGDRRVLRIAPDGSAETFATTSVGNLSGLLVHPESGVVYVTNASSNTVEIVRPDGTLEPFLSNDGEAPELRAPVGLAVDDDGRLYVSNFSDGKILRVEDDGALTEIADLAGPIGFTTGFITYANGSLFATGIGTHVVEEVSLATGEVTVLAGTGSPGTEDGSGAEARFNGPNGIVASVTGDTLYVSGYNSRAVRRIIRSQATASEEGPPALAHDRLVLAAPNPSGGALSVRFELASAQHVSLTVRDVLGRTAAVLVEEHLPAGAHGVQRELSGLPAGPYVILLRTARSADSRVVSIVR